MLEVLGSEQFVSSISGFKTCACPRRDQGATHGRGAIVQGHKVALDGVASERRCGECFVCVSTVTLPSAAMLIFTAL